MAVTKCTMLMNYQSNVSSAQSNTRTGGFSESWYTQNTNIEALRAAFLNLCRLRALFLPKGSAVIGQRYQIVEPKGGSAQTAVTFAGNRQFVADAPQVAVMVRIPSKNTPNVRMHVFRAVPDARAVEGEFSPSTAFSQHVSSFLQELDVQAWRFKARDLEQVLVPVVSVNNAGDVVTLENINVATTGYVSIIKTITDERRKRGGIFKVSLPATDATHFRVYGWKYGTTEGGTARIHRVIYPQCSFAERVTPKVVIRKVGRPFGGYVGRRSNRH